MQKLIPTLLSFFLFVTTTLAANPYDVVLDDDGKIQIDTQNPREITGCWDSDEKAVMFYRDDERNIIASEICNEEDEMHHGLGISVKARALNYYDFLNQTLDDISQVEAPVVLGSLSGYNYQFMKEFLALPDACEKFDILAFHPYHLGVAPDEIDTSKNTYHTVTQWVNFYREILEAKGCGEKPIWVTEFGYSTQDYDDEKAVSETLQSDYALKQLVMLLGENVERVGYFNDLSFALGEGGVEAWNDLVEKLEGSKLENFAMSGESYCPREESCFYDENEYRIDSGKAFFGLEASPNGMKKNRAYTFVKDDGSRVFVFWETEKPGVGILESSFTDISLNTPYVNSILKIAEKGVINGYPDKTFKPDITINRAEFLKILVEATKDEGVSFNGNNCFPDVTTQWFAPYVCYAEARGWVGGYDDGLFKPSNSVNRAEALKMIANAFGWETSSVSGEWYLPFANAALSKGVLLPEEAQNYGEAQNRGFIAEIIWRSLE